MEFDPEASIDLMFMLYGGYGNPEFQQMVHDATPYLVEFSKRYDQKLLFISATMEEGAFEPAYIFDDGVGFHYTLEGVVKSIREE